MQHKNQNLKIAAVATYMSTAVNVIVGFISVPLLISSLGKSEYGLYQIVASFLAYITVIESSVSAGALRYYCEAKAENNERKMANILAICRRIYRLLSLFMALFAVVIVVLFRLFYKSSFSANELDEGSLMLVLLCLNLIITMQNAVYFAAVKGNERFTFIKIVDISAKILQLIVYALVIKRSPYAITVTFVQVLINALVTIVRYFYAQKGLEVIVHLYEYDKSIAKNLLEFSAGILLAIIADQIFWKTDQIILGKMHDTATVAVYSVGSQIYTYYMNAGTPVASVFFPRVSEYYHKENGLELINELFVRVGRIAFYICFLVLTGFVVFGKEFLRLWVGSDFEPAYAMAIVVMIPFTIDIIQNLGLTILQVMDRYSFRAKMYFVAAVLNMVSTAIMAYFWGGYGAALSTGISMFLTSGIILNIFYHKRIGLNVIAFWKNILRIIIVLLPVAIVGYFVNLHINLPCSIINLALKAVTYSIVYMLVSYFGTMNAYEKNIVRSLAGKLIKR